MLVTRSDFWKVCARKEIELPRRVQLPVVFDQRFDNFSDSGSSTTTLIFPPSLTKQTSPTTLPAFTTGASLFHNGCIHNISFPSFIVHDRASLGGKISLHLLQPYFSSTPSFPQFLSRNDFVSRPNFPSSKHTPSPFAKRTKFSKVSIRVRTRFFSNYFAPVAPSSKSVLSFSERRVPSAISQAFDMKKRHFSLAWEINRRKKDLNFNLEDDSSGIFVLLQSWI